MGRPHLYPIHDHWQPTSWLQQPGKWIYNPMSKSATNEELWGDLIQILLLITDSQQADCNNLWNELTIPCLSQRPHDHMHTYIAHALRITYSMAYFKMAYQLHVQGPIRRWSIYLLIQQYCIMWNIQARYVKKMIVMTTGGEYCNFHRVNSRVKLTVKLVKQIRREESNSDT